MLLKIACSSAGDQATNSGPVKLYIYLTLYHLKLSEIVRFNENLILQLHESFLVFFFLFIEAIAKYAMQKNYNFDKPFSQTTELIYNYLLMAHNWQKWKRVFLICPWHKIYRVEAVGLKSSNYTFKIMVLVNTVNMWNLGQFHEKMIFCP